MSEVRDHLAIKKFGAKVIEEELVLVRRLGGLGGQLLAGRLATGGLPCGLLSTSHSDGLVEFARRCQVLRI